MKRVLSILVFSLAFFVMTNAQSLEEATQLYNDGAAALSGGSLDAALTNFEKALAMAESIGEEGATLVANCKGIIPGIYLAISQDLIKAQKNSEAIEKLKVTVEKAVEFDDMDTEFTALDLIPQLYYNNGAKFLAEEKFAEAIEEFKKTVEYNAENGKAYLNMGIAYSRLNDEANTIETLEKAAQLGEEANAKRQLSNFFLKKSNEARTAKNNQASMDYAKKSMDYMDNAQANQLYGLAALQLKRHKEAIVGLEAYVAKSQGKNLNSMYYQLATAYEATGNKSQACGYYKKILDDKQFGEFAKHKVNTELKCN